MDRPRPPFRRRDTTPLALYGDGAGDRYPAEAIPGASSSSTSPPVVVAVDTSTSRSNVSKPLPPVPADDVSEKSTEGLFQKPLNRAPGGESAGNNTSETSPTLPTSSSPPELPSSSPARVGLGLGLRSKASQQFRRVTQNLPPLKRKFGKSKANLRDSLEDEQINTRRMREHGFESWNTDGADHAAFEEAAAMSSSPEYTSSPMSASSPPANLTRTPTGNRPFTTVFPDLIEDEATRAYAITAAQEAYRQPSPEYDILNPKPATKQRYVAAGGTTPLRDRPEIAAPPLATPSGFAISRTELLAKLEEDKKREHLANLIKARESAESNKTQTSGSSRKVGEYFKRVFSRKNSRASDTTGQEQE